MGIVGDAEFRENSGCSSNLAREEDRFMMVPLVSQGRPRGRFREIPESSHTNATQGIGFQSSSTAHLDHGSPTHRRSGGENAHDLLRIGHESGQDVKEVVMCGVDVDAFVDVCGQGRDDSGIGVKLIQAESHLPSLDGVTRGERAMDEPRQRLPDHVRRHQRLGSADVVRLPVDDSGRAHPHTPPRRGSRCLRWI